MKIKVRVDNQDYEVEVGDLDVNPIVAVVQGERFEVWAEDAQGSNPAPADPGAASEAPAAAPARAHAPVPVWKPRQTDVIPGTENAIIAPIPGVLISVDVKVGDRVEYGQVVCILEAMKMRNPIRVAKPGVVTEVKVKPGQHMHYHESMIIVTPEG